MACKETTDLRLPDKSQRIVGTNWLKKYGHLVTDDPGFAAAAVYRLMIMAKVEPDAPELQGLK